MKTIHYITLLIIAFCCTSCYTYRMPKGYQDVENTNVKRKVYVVNNSLKKELRILKKAQLFSIVEDSLSADLKIKLYPIQRHSACGQAGIVTIVTIGQIPVVYWDHYTYRFDEIGKDKVTERKVLFELNQRVWFWDMFAFNKRFAEKAGKLILGSYKSGN